MRPDRMSRFGLKADGVLEGAEGRSLTQLGHSRGWVHTLSFEGLALEDAA